MIERNPSIHPYPHLAPLTPITKCRRPGPAGLEDGTLPFAGIAAAAHGFAVIRRLGGFPAVGRHADCLARHLAAGLAALRHGGSSSATGAGGRVAELYGWDDDVEHAVCVGAGALLRPPVSSQESTWGRPRRGPTVAFNLLRPDGQYVGYGEVRSHHVPGLSTPGDAPYHNPVARLHTLPSFSTSHSLLPLIIPKVRTLASLQGLPPSVPACFCLVTALSRTLCSCPGAHGGRPARPALAVRRPLQPGGLRQDAETRR